MPRKTRDGKELKRVLQWHLNRDVTDAEIAVAISKPPATYSRYKDTSDFPSFEELRVIGEAFGVTPRWLHVQFGDIDPEELREMPAPLMARRKGGNGVIPKSGPKLPKIRPDAPPLGG